jgi:hypothetical protein
MCCESLQPFGTLDCFTPPLVELSQSGPWTILRSYWSISAIKKPGLYYALIVRMQPIMSLDYTTVTSVNLIQ